MHGGYLPPHYYDGSDKNYWPPHIGKPGWYFYDECELPVGPYPTEEECAKAQKEYRP